MKVKTDYDKCGYITPGKIYEVSIYGDPEYPGQRIIDDDGDEIEIIAPPFHFECGHLDDKGVWLVVEES